MNTRSIEKSVATTKSRLRVFVQIMAGTCRSTSVIEIANGHDHEVSEFVGKIDWFLNIGNIERWNFGTSKNNGWLIVYRNFCGFFSSSMAQEMSNVKKIWRESRFEAHWTFLLDDNASITILWAIDSRTSAALEQSDSLYDMLNDFLGGLFGFESNKKKKFSDFFKIRFIFFYSLNFSTKSC